MPVSTVDSRAPFQVRLRRYKWAAAGCVAGMALVAGQASAQTQQNDAMQQQDDQTGQQPQSGQTDTRSAPPQGAVAGEPSPNQGSGAPTAQAASTTDSSGGIVVTGFRASLRSSIAKKRTSNEIVEVVSSEDIGKLPDVSIAESLARLPGIAGQRVDGRVQNIEVRGLPDQFTTTLLNGRQQVSSGDNRAAEFDQYPSELISSAIVYKTSNAALVGQGLAGTVDMRSLQPLTLNGPAIAINGRAEVNQFNRLNPDGHRWGYRVSASVVDQFFDDTLGVSIGYAHLDSPTQIKHQKSWYWEPGTLPTPNQDVLTLGGQEVRADNRIQKRDGVMATIQWDPHSNFKSSVDFFYSTFKQDEILRGMEWFSTPNTPDGTVFLNPGISELGSTRASFTGAATNVTPIVNNQYNKRLDHLLALGWNAAYKLGATTVALDLGYSRVHRKEQSLETYSGYVTDWTPNLATASPYDGTSTRVFDTIGYDINPDGFSTYSPGLD
ncbi:MAG: TonB-dependent receptor plug domain-containing protein [Sphingomonas sp.]